MGQGQSTTNISKRDYQVYKEKFQSINSELATERKKSEGYLQDLEMEKENNRGLRSTLDQLSSVCLVDKQNLNLSKNDLKKTGEKIYRMLSNRYRENIHILETQQRLIDKQNRLTGVKDVQLAEQKDKLKELNKKIQKNDRLLMYDNEDYKKQNNTINLLKIVTVILVAILLIILIIGVIKKLRKKSN